MQKIIIMAVCLLTTLCTTAQKKQTTDPNAVIQALGKNRILELEATQRLGEAIDSMTKSNSAMHGCWMEKKIQHDTIMYMFNDFIFVILPRPMVVRSTESSKYNVQSRYMSMTLDGRELPDGEKPKAALRCLLKK